MNKSYLIALLFILFSTTNSYANEADAKIQLELGKIEANNKNYEKSIEHFKGCVLHFTGCAYNIGVNYEKIGQPDNAIPWYNISARQGLKEAKHRLAVHNQPIPDNDLEREFKAKQKTSQSEGPSQGLWNAVNAILSGYNRGADSVLRSKQRNASCTTIGNTTDCYEY